MTMNEKPVSDGVRGGSLVPAAPNSAGPFAPAMTPYGVSDPYGWGTQPPAAKAFSSAPFIRYWRSILLVTVLLAAPAIAAVWLFSVPQYTASGQIRVRPIIPHLVFRTEDSGTIPFYQSYLNTQVALVLRPEVLNRVLDKEDVKSTFWYRQKTGQDNPGQDQPDAPWYTQALGSALADSRSHMERLREDLSVRPRGNTEIIDVALTALNPADAAIIVNAALDQYLAYTTETSDTTSNVLYQELVREHEKLRSELAGHETVVTGLRKQLETNEPDQLIAQMRVRLDEAAARLESLRRQINAAEWEEQDAWRQIRQDPAVARLLHPRLIGASNVLRAEIQALEQAEAAKPGQPAQAATGIPPAPDQPPALPPEQAASADTPTRLASLRQELAAVERQAKELSALLRPERTPDGTPPGTEPPGVSGYCWPGIAEIQVLSNKQDVARGMPASADSFQPNTDAAKTGDDTIVGHKPGAANDGEPETSWRPKDGDLTHWWKVDLQKKHDLSGVRITFVQGGVNWYKLEVSPDERTWELVVDKTQAANEQETQEDGFEASGVQYVRVTGRGTPFGYDQDLEWRRLYTQLQAARLEQEVGQERLMPEHPQMKELAKRVAFSEKLLHEREATLDTQWQTQTQAVAGRPVSERLTAGTPGEPEVIARMRNAHRQAGQLRREEKLLAEGVEQERKGFKQAFEQAQTLAKETEAIRHKREVYEAVRMRLAQKEMERNVPGSIEVTKAFVPSEPSRDRRLLLTAMALAGALGAGVALAFLRSNMSQAIHEPDDLPPAIQAPFLGQLPLVSAKDGAPPEKSPLLMECVRMVRTALLQRLDGKGGSIVQITSAGPGAGKSTLAVMLGRSLAQGGKSVLLVDADLWHPTLAQRFSLSENPGFHESLADRRPDPDTVCETETPGLSVLPAGQLQEGFNPDLMANGFFAACLERWRQRYDIVVLDSSPILPVAAGRILAQRADGTIMVVREKHCRRTEVAEALRHLEIAGGNLLGAVLIGSGRSGKYGTGYYYAGKYGHDYYQSRTDNGGA